ncbi:hypothetical protein JZ751_026012 [Albula glossodonta]|uniref:Uncharacterized protein n=1 Tax=Albula glossodonta TaxID=121402 RepID=A0A8T2MST1_9TELE|nr:hypothetical protein JZ751_026012 [Albula glossodonta]
MCTKVGFLAVPRLLAELISAPPPPSPSPRHVQTGLSELGLGSRHARNARSTAQCCGCATWEGGVLENALIFGNGASDSRGHGGLGGGVGGGNDGRSLRLLRVIDGRRCCKPSPTATPCLWEEMLQAVTRGYTMPLVLLPELTVLTSRR